MSTLYVDVDDTLVKWADAVEGRLVTEWERNEDVVVAIKRWRAKWPFGRLVIWSSGGRDYARTWADRLLKDETWEAEAKWAIVPDETKTFIDDAPFACFASRTIHPRDVACWDP